MTNSVKLSEQELNLAFSYIQATTASDFFPHPFEFTAIGHFWNKIRPILERVDLLNYEPQSALEIVAPKQRALVRVVHLLDPIDTILYTGLIMKIGAIVQSKRNEYQKNRVFSWHFNATASSPQDTFRSNWDGFRKQAVELSKKYHYIATADIVDFFQRIYLHRLQNSIEDITNDIYITRSIMRLIENWSHGTSYGIPTGPHGSNFLAEILLIEVDQYLLSCNIQFIRWIDDIVIFGNSESECLEGLYRLGTRLQQTQGLSLNSAKTRIYTTKDYRSKVLHENDPTTNLRDKIIKEVFDGNPYAIVDYEKLTSEEKAVINELDIENSLTTALSEDLVDLRSANFVLRVLTALKRPDLIDPVLDSLDDLLPVADSVSKFLSALADIETANHHSIGSRVIEYLNGDSFVPEFQKMWLLDPYTKSSKWNSLNELRIRAREDNSKLIRRQAILGLGKIRDRSSLLDVKSSIDDARDWERRAIIYACRALPKDERDAIITQLGGSGGDWSVQQIVYKALLAYIKQL